MESKGEILIYQSPAGNTKVHVRLNDETVWLSQNQMSELLQTTKQNISLHIKNIYDEGELQQDSTVKDYLTDQLFSADVIQEESCHIAVQKF